MREIKFRAFNTSDKEMYSDAMAKRILYMESIGESIPERFKIMQFTGLRDLNGKEIYEGDIVKDVDGKYSAIVEYIAPEFVRHTNEYSLRNQILPFKSHHSYEIIGNIYENPELLNK